MRGGKREGAGRKLIDIDLLELEKLAAMQVTDEELAGFFKVSVRTIENRRKNKTFEEIFARGRARGKISIRRAQLKCAEAGNGALLIWLGKQYLGQRDVTPIELSGPNGKELKISLEVINELISKTKNKKTVA